jgi:hypothetical protein
MPPTQAPPSPRPRTPTSRRKPSHRKSAPSAGSSSPSWRWPGERLLRHGLPPRLLRQPRKHRNLPVPVPLGVRRGRRRVTAQTLCWSGVQTRPGPPLGNPRHRRKGTGLQPQTIRHLVKCQAPGLMEAIKPGGTAMVAPRNGYRPTPPELEHRPVDDLGTTGGARGRPAQAAPRAVAVAHVLDQFDAPPVTMTSRSAVASTVASIADPST